MDKSLPGIIKEPKEQAKVGVVICLKNEKHLKQKFLRDKNGHYYFYCKACGTYVRIRKAVPQLKKRGNEHLKEHLLC